MSSSSLSHLRSSLSSAITEAKPKRQCRARAGTQPLRRSTTPHRQSATIHPVQDSAAGVAASAWSGVVFLSLPCARCTHTDTAKPPNHFFPKPQTKTPLPLSSLHPCRRWRPPDRGAQCFSRRLPPSSPSSSLCCYCSRLLPFPPPKQMPPCRRRLCFRLRRRRHRILPIATTTPRLLAPH